MAEEHDVDDAGAYLSDARHALDELTDANESGAATVDGRIYACLFTLFALCKDQQREIETIKARLAAMPAGAGTSA